MISNAATAMIHKAVTTLFPTMLTKFGPAVAPTPAGTSANEGRRRYRIVVSSPALDLQRDRVLMGAVDVATAKPVPLIISHDHNGLQIGMVGEFNYRPNGELEATMSLPRPGVSQKADELDGLIRDGIGPQFSLGFNADEHRPNIAGGIDFSKITIREVSVCPVGAAIGTRVLAQVKGALAARRKGNQSGYGDVSGPDHSRGTGDPTRDTVASAQCPKAGLCPKRTGEPCTMAGGCPLHLGGSGTGGGKHASVWAKQNIPPADDQMGHDGGSERQRGGWAWEHGMTAVKARQRDAEQRRGWDDLKTRLLALDPRERPLLRPFIDISRTDLEAMPADVQAVACGHLDLDSDLNGA